MGTRHTFSTNLDKRLVSYAANSFNAYDAVYGLQQMACLLPSYTRDLESMYGKAGIGDARRAWGVVADLISAIATVAPTMETLIEFGFSRAIEVDHVIVLDGDFALSTSPILRRLDFRAAILGDLGPVMMTAVHHDSLAKPLLEAFQEEIRRYDTDAASNVHGDTEVRNFCDVVLSLPDEPEYFPLWDDRPMFLDEQKALLDYLAKNIGAEVVADALVGEPLGEFLLRSSGVISRSDFNGEQLLDVNLVPHDLLKKPVELICHEAGRAALNALRELGDGADVIDRLYVVETAVRTELGIDVAGALASTRTLMVERAIRDLFANVTDIRRVNKDELARSATPFEFPDFGSDT